MAENYIIPTPGDVIAGKYHIEQELGRGAFGVVFRARQRGIDRDVALKTLLPKAFLDADIVARFEREANFVGRLNHPNIVGVHDYGRYQNLLYMAVEYVEGDNLADIIRRDGALDPSRVRRLVDQLAGALDHAHQAGIVHRDLKPANIVVLDGGDSDTSQTGEVVKVLDFGIAKLLQSETDGDAPDTLTQAGTVLGTPHYMSPEAIVGESIDHRADIYSLGIIIYEMLTSQRPFGGKNSPGIMVKQLREDPPPLPAPLADSRWSAVVRGCLTKRVDRRLQSAGQIADILDGADLEFHASASGGAIADQTGAASHRGALIAATLLGVVVAVVIAVAFDLIPPGGSNEPASRATQRPGRPTGPTADTFGAAARPAPGHVADRQTDVGLPPSDPPRPLTIETAPRDAQALDTPRDTAVPDAVDSPDHHADDPDSTAPPARPAPPPSHHLADEHVQLSIQTIPPDAQVTIDGAPVGASPLTHEIDRSQTPVTIQLSHIGYQRMYQTVVPSRDRTVEVHLHKGRLELSP